MNQKYKDSKILLEQVQNYWNKLNKNTSLADAAIPDFIEKSTKLYLLKQKDICDISKIWKTNATNFILFSNIKNKVQALQILEDEIKFQNYLWNKKTKEHYNI